MIFNCWWYYGIPFSSMRVCTFTLDFTLDLNFLQQSFHSDSNDCRLHICYILTMWQYNKIYWPMIERLYCSISDSIFTPTFTFVDYVETAILQENAIHIKSCITRFLSRYIIRQKETNFYSDRFYETIWFIDHEIFSTSQSTFQWTYDRNWLGTCKSF